MTDPWSRPAEEPPQPYPTQQDAPTGPPADSPADSPRQGSRFTRFFRDPVSIVLAVVIVIALIAAGLVGTELYARHRGEQIVSQSTGCIVQDGVSVSFGATPLVWQYLTKHYTGITITTAGNNIRNIKGMKAVIDVDDVRVSDTGDSKGTIGSLNAAITWSSSGIKDTIQSSIPIIGGFITGVTPNPSDGTIELAVPLGSIVVKPEVVDNGISLQVEKLTGLGFTLPRETIQPALDAFSGELTKNYPLGIKADTVTVTDSGVEARFSAQNATMSGSGGNQDPCFAPI